MDWIFGATDAIAAADAAGGQSALANPLFVMIPLMVIFYFLLIRPQQKKQKEHREMLNKLQKGDTVLTQGGLQGKVTGLTETIVTLEVADKVRVKISRPYIAGVLSKGEGEAE